MKKIFKVIKSSDSNLIMSMHEGKNVDILKIAQRGNDSLQREYETILKLKKFSRVYDNIIPKIYLDKKIKSSYLQNRFFYFQKYYPGLTLSALVQQNKIRNTNAKKISEAIIKKLVAISKEDLKNCVNEKPSEIFRKLLMTEFQNIIKRPHLKFLSSKLSLKIGNRFYNKLESSLDKIFSKKSFINLDKQEKFLVDTGHFNFHGENILISDVTKPDQFKLIDPDTRWKVIDPMFSLARYFYTYWHDTGEKKKYYIKCNIYDFEKKNKNFYFKTEVLWPDKINNVYEKMFDVKLLKSKLNKIDKLRFNLSYLLCLMRGINANYEEKINFYNYKNNIFQNNGILFTLLAIIFADQISKEK